jgi:transcriptional regulator with XRE-family HTH domain
MGNIGIKEKVRGLRSGKVQMNFHSDLDVGTRLRYLRKKTNLTLRELSERSGLSINAISRIEKNLTSPTVSTLHRLAMALEIPVGAIFQEDVVNTVVHVRAGNRQKMPMKGKILELLGTGMVDPLTEPFVVTLEGGEKSTTSFFRHPGEEFAFCLQGKIIFYIEGQAFVLEEGDSLLFKSDQGHAWENPSSDPAKFLLIFVGCESDQTESGSTAQIVNEYI